MALPRTGKVSHGKSLNALVTHGPRWWSAQIRLPTATGRRRPVWIDAQAVRLRPRGHVPVAFSNGRRNDGPNQPTLRVTHRPEIVPTRHMIAIYRRRWGVEVLCQAWQGVVGMGQHQVPKQVDRVERSVAVAIMAYLLRLKLRAKAIPADRPWSAFRLLRAFAWEMEQAQGERLAWPIARKWLQMANAA